MPLCIQCTWHTAVHDYITHTNNVVLCHCVITRTTWHTAVHDYITHTNNVVLCHCVITRTMYSTHSFAPCHNTYNVHPNNVSRCHCVITRTMYSTHSSALCDYAYNILDKLSCTISLHILTMCRCVTMSLHVQCPLHTLLFYVITHTTYSTHSRARFHFTYWQCVAVSLCHYTYNVLDTPCDYTYNIHNTLSCTIYYTYGVATNSRLLKIICLFCRIASFL